MASSSAEIDAVAELLAGATMVAVDTEFVREKTYYPQLCLIQVATDTRAACIDCLSPVDFAPIYAQLFRDDCTWVIHSARQDLEVIWQRTQRLPPHLIDTQMAAALAGFPPQIGLEGLLSRTLGVELGESFARTDWSRRPLPAAALDYALDDVRYLLPAWRKVEAQLAELGRLAWLDEDGARALAERPEPDPLIVWSRIKGTQGLSFPSQCAALALVEWREGAAQRADRPRRWLLADEALLAIADALPRQVDDLGDRVSPRFAARHGAELIVAVARHTEPALVAAVRAYNAQQIPDRKQIKALQESVKARATALGLEAEILATRRELAALAAGAPPPHLAAGWRAAELAVALAPTAAPLPGQPALEAEPAPNDAQ